MLMPQGLVVHCNKKDQLIFDTSFMLSDTTVTYNNLINLSQEPIITFASAWTNHLIRIYNLRISYPCAELYTMEDDATGAFW